MRILLAANGSDSQTLAAVDRLLPQAEVVLTQASDSAPDLELALRNALPDREVVTVPVQVVVDDEEPTAPRGILGLRSLRTLIESGSLVICVLDRTPPVVIGKTGKMEPIGAAIETEPAFELLARRLDAQPIALRKDPGELGYARLP
ncbi:MAG TPA: hypothetical protein VFJ53_02140 [Solirubrobacterales bacterium]|nr:hypothetical protein [Solirubrobacterales bacterium]